MEPFQVDTIDLTMRDPSTGRFRTANIYTIDGIENADGSLRELSIGQLVMAVCLNRASEMENSIIDLMEKMNTTSSQLAAMTEIEEKLLDFFNSDSSNVVASLTNYTISSGDYAGMTYKDFLVAQEVIGSGIGFVRSDSVQSSMDILLKDFTSALESKMDQMNSLNQRDMISLQSMTNKRDQAYDMITNILKSLNSTMTGIANNV